LLADNIGILSTDSGRFIQSGGTVMSNVLTLNGDVDGSVRGIVESLLNVSSEGY
jgi:hypothetical protein